MTKKLAKLIEYKGVQLLNLDPFLKVLFIEKQICKREWLAQIMHEKEMVSEEHGAFAGASHEDARWGADKDVSDDDK
jgi:hypothetical protein